MNDRSRPEGEAGKSERGELSELSGAQFSYQKTRWHPPMTMATHRAGVKFNGFTNHSQRRSGNINGLNDGTFAARIVDYRMALGNLDPTAFLTSAIEPHHQIRSPEA